jgi:eukaryotic-like serine/threonine-protein kinase
VSDFPTELQDALKDRYEILRELGRGGMAVVYAARDLKMDREVAIKVLLPDLAVAMGPERFTREIAIAGHLSNPHILAIYDSGNAHGRLYYVMPLVRGESLRARIDREKQLPLEDALRLSIEVARALDYAHKQGVVHRDIKPENILLEDGSAIVADFGIARAISTMHEGQALTQTGMSLGTASYMSPEQVAAEKNIDGRSDVYSLACVTYEMLAGQPPFTGPNSMAIMARQALEMPPSLTVVRSTVPDEVEETVFQALAKLPVDRFQSAGEYADALQDCLDSVPRTTRRTTQVRMTQNTMARRRVRRRRKAVMAAGLALGAVAAGLALWQLVGDRSARATVAGDQLDARSIAVLYFEDLSRDSSLGHVADALTEGLINELAAVNGLHVVSRNGSAAYRASGLSPDSVARALGTGSLIQGTVEPVGRDLRVTTWLVDGNSGADRDRRTFTVPASAAMTGQDSVVRTAALLLRERVGDLRLQQTRAGTASVDAWSFEQRAERLRKQALAQRDSGDLAAANASYVRADSVLALAEAIDRNWSAPTTLRAQIAFERASLQPDASIRTQMLDSAVAHASRALTLEPNYAAALSVRGRARRAQYIIDAAADPAARARLLDSAQADLEAATRADGTQADAFFALSQVYYDRKDNVSALIAARRAYESDAFLRNQHINVRQLFWTHYDLEQFPDADRWCREGARRFPDRYLFAECQLWMMLAPWKAPDIPRAWNLAARAEALAPANRQPFERHLARVIVAGALARAGMPDSARNVLARALPGRDIDPEQELTGYGAIVHVLLGDHSKAIDLLKQYVVLHPTHEFSVGRDLHWWWRPLQSEPEFQAVLARRR